MSSRVENVKFIRCDGCNTEKVDSLGHLSIELRANDHGHICIDHVGKTLLLSENLPMHFCDIDCLCEFISNALDALRVE